MKKTAKTPEGISEMREKIRELEQTNRDLTGMIQNSYDAMCIVDGDGTILMQNPAFEKVMGLKNTDFIGKRVPDIVKEGLTDTAATMKVLETGREATVIINTIAGKQVLSTATPVYGENGKIHRIYCNMRDITDLNRLREQHTLTRKLASKYLTELNELKKLQTAQFRFITRNNAMRKILDFAYHMAQFDSTALILGESGVGKDLVARLLHEAGPRNETGEFIKINCGAIPEPLLESELFGYEAGAFTGARREGKIGYFELAHKGTLFLDEIGDLPMGLQVKLLGVIQDQKVYRLASRNPKEIDVRIIAATNRDLEKMMVAGQFREDLYYRLNVVPIRIPPLRERKDDIPFLLAHFLEDFKNKHRNSIRFSNEVLEFLTAYNWPGNVRELCNLTERLVLSVHNALIMPEDLPHKYRQPKKENTGNGKGFLSLKEQVERFELELVAEALARCSSQEEAASRLKVSLSSLTRRVRKLRERQNWKSKLT